MERRMTARNAEISDEQFPEKNPFGAFLFEDSLEMPLAISLTQNFENYLL